MKNMTALMFALFCWSSPAFGQTFEEKKQQEEEENKALLSQRDKAKGVSDRGGEFRLGVGMATERWADSSIPIVYGRGGKAMPMVSLSYRVFQQPRFGFAVDAEAGMGRLTANTDRNILQIVPVTVGGSLLFGSQNIEPFIGVGAGFVQYSEQLLPYVTSTSPTVTYGTKLGTDVRAGIRIGTRMVQHSQHPTSPQGPKQMDVEILIGQRVHHAFGIGTGLNLNAFRASIAMKFRI